LKFMGQRQLGIEELCITAYPFCFLAEAKDVYRWLIRRIIVFQMKYKTKYALELETS